MTTGARWANGAPCLRDSGGKFGFSASVEIQHLPARVGTKGLDILDLSRSSCSSAFRSSAFRCSSVCRLPQPESLRLPPSPRTHARARGLTRGHEGGTAGTTMFWRSVAQAKCSRGAAPRKVPCSCACSCACAPQRDPHSDLPLAPSPACAYRQRRVRTAVVVGALSLRPCPRLCHVVHIFPRVCVCACCVWAFVCVWLWL